MFEIHVDVGRLFAFFGNEAFEQQVNLVGVNRGDADDVTDSGIGRTATALTEDGSFAAAGEFHDVVDGEKIRRVVEFFDEDEFFADIIVHPLRHTIGVTLLRPFMGEMGEPALRVHAGWHGFFGIFIAQLIQ